MYEMPKCECGEELEFDRDDYYDADGEVIISKCWGHCPKCGKQYTWLDHFEISHYSDLEETE